MKNLQSKSDNVFDAINVFFMIIAILIFVYPLWFIVVASISSPEMVWSGNISFLPKDFTLAGYKKIFENSNIWLGYKNSLFYMVTGTIVNLLFTITAAYPLSRKDFKVKNHIMGLYIFTMFFSGGLIPTYLLIDNLQLLNSPWVMILPGAVSVSNLIIVKTYFQTSISEELLFAAQIDGCTNFMYFIKIVLPLSKPIIAVMALFFGVGHWNSYFNAMIYLTDRTLMPLQIFLREILIQSQFTKQASTENLMGMAEQIKLAESIKYGVIVVSSLPVLMIYPFVQKYFIKGVMIGSLKG